MAKPRPAVPDDLMRTEDTAAMLHCSPGALYTMRSRGAGPPAYRVGSRLLFSRSEVLTWLAEHRADGTSTQAAS